MRFVRVALAIALCVAPAMARQDVRETSSVPSAVVDLFEDGDQHLRLVGVPSADGASMDVTLIYEDSDLREMRSISIRPDALDASAQKRLAGFLEGMDSDFVSYVKASLADRFLHLRAEPTSFERAEATLFFPGRMHAGNVARRAADSESTRLE